MEGAECMSEPQYKRILLKISGEALAGEASRGLDFGVIGQVCEVIKQCNQMGVQVGIVVGGGNFWRGVKDGAGRMERTRADHMGMMATTLNCLALADVLAGDPGYAVTTFVLKFIIGVVCGFTAHRLCRIDAAAPGRRLPYLARVTVSAGSGLLVNVFTDPLLGYFRNVYIFGQDYSAAQVLASVAGGVTLVNSLVSTLCAVLLYLAVRPALDRAGLLPKPQDHSLKQAHRA